MTSRSLKVMRTERCAWADGALNDLIARFARQAEM